MERTPQVGSWSFVVAGVIVVLLYAANLIYCQHSILQLLDAAVSGYSDMHANLMWAEGIREQGWLNPRPYHPWTDWMQTIAPYPQWVEWWGGEQTFQQSPLYTYLLSLFMHKYLSMRILQALLSIGTCTFIGLFTARIAGRTAGWIAFWLAALYAPFYLYSWPFLRDGLGWFLIAALLWALSELARQEWSARRAAPLAWLVGTLLGLGFLAKETYLLLIPLVWAALACFAWKRRQWDIVARVALGTVLTVSPLLIRNSLVEAPLFSSSNRFAEVFISGNAGDSSPYLFSIPREMGSILYETHGRTLPLIRAIVASHPDGVRGWMRLQLLKLRSLLDPYESPDNLSFYFVEHISPVVRFGLRYWMILPPALAGLFLGLRRHEQAHLWIWIFLPVFLAGLLIGIPVSRYRQSLMVMLIPCAAYFLAFLYGLIRRSEFRLASICCVVLLAGWWSVLGPLSQQPRERYERPNEYLLSVQLYHQLGDEPKAQAILDVVRQKFPGLLP